MSNPEISRRCAACGATVRQRAMFCPQCGSEMGERSDEDQKPFDPFETIAESRDVSTNIEAAPPTSFDPTVTQPLSSVPPPKDFSETIAESRDVRTNIEAAQPTSFDPTVTQPLIPVLPPTEPLRKGIPVVDEKAHTQALNAVQGQAPPTTKLDLQALSKVGKLKRASTVVLDQAAYDPSVRFLLVAAGLFLMFLFLLVLSKMVG